MVEVCFEDRVKIGGIMIKRGDALDHNDSIWQLISDQTAQPGRSSVYTQI